MQGRVFFRRLNGTRTVRQPTTFPLRRLNYVRRTRASVARRVKSITTRYGLHPEKTLAKRLSAPGLGARRREWTGSTLGDSRFGADSGARGAKSRRAPSFDRHLSFFHLLTSSSHRPCEPKRAYANSPHSERCACEAGPERAPAQVLSARAALRDAGTGELSKFGQVPKFGLVIFSKTEDRARARAPSGIPQKRVGTWHLVGRPLTGPSSGSKPGASHRQWSRIGG